MRRAILLIVVLLLAGSAAQAQGRWEGRWRFRDQDRRHAHLQVFGNFDLPKDSTSEGPLVLIGGTSQIDGHVPDDVVVIGGTVQIGPTAIVDGDVVHIGGNLTIDPAAQIHGDVTGLGGDWPGVHVQWPEWGGWWARGFAFGATMVRLCLVFFGGLLLILVVPGGMRSIAQRVSAMPGVSAIIGFAVEMFLVPALIALAIALVISIVGIPLLAGIPILVAALACVWVAGFTATASRVGASIRGDRGTWAEPRVADFVVGFLALTGVTIVGRIAALGPLWTMPIASLISAAGLFIEYCAWTIGLGAAIGAIVAGRRHSPPPPIPPIPTPPPAPTS